MLCQQCRKRPATVQITQITDGHKVELHLCEECALKSGKLDFISDPQVSLENFLTGLLQSDINAAAGARPAGVQCQACGMTYQEFSRTGKLGCAECYRFFMDQLQPVFRRIHGNTRHHGKLPRRLEGAARARREVQELRERLRRAVEAENFEEAAALRDEIRLLEASLNQEPGKTGG